VQVLLAADDAAGRHRASGLLDMLQRIGTARAPLRRGGRSAQIQLVGLAGGAGQLGWWRQLVDDLLYGAGGQGVSNLCPIYARNRSIDRSR